MKTRISIISIILILFVFTSCMEDIASKKSNSIVPNRFKIDIPNSLSKSNIYKSANSNDTLKGSEIYKMLNFFIAIGEASSDLTEGIMIAIARHNIQSIISMSYKSDEDMRIKDLDVESNVEFEGKTWEYQMTIADSESADNDDFGIGMQVFWNTGEEIEGIAILKPYNINRNEKEALAEAIYRIDYSELGNDTYNHTMTIAISGLTQENDDVFWVDNFKMFVGEKDGVVDVFGNSNHPDARFFTDEVGFNWAFVASSNRNDDIAVAEIGLPKSNLDSESRSTILEEYSVKNVITDQINNWFLDNFNAIPAASDIEAYLQNTAAPGYFNNQGFIQGGTAPNNNYNSLETRIEKLIPYNPSTISALSINFK